METKMNKSEMKQVSLALMYGDSYVDTNKTSGKSRLDIYHCDKQKDYLLYKVAIMKSLPFEVGLVKEKVDKRPTKNGGRVGWRVQTGFSTYLYNLSVAPHKFVVKQLVKPRALAILWMDDGTICWDSKGYYSTGYLCTDSWDEQFLKGFLKEFNKLYGWRPILMDYKCRGVTYKRLRFTKNMAQKFSDIIKSYVIPCMEYKLVS